MLLVRLFHFDFLAIFITISLLDFSADFRCRGVESADFPADSRGCFADISFILLIPPISIRDIVASIFCIIFELDFIFDRCRAASLLIFFISSSMWWVSRLITPGDVDATMLARAVKPPPPIYAFDFFHFFHFLARGHFLDVFLISLWWVYFRWLRRPLIDYG